MWPSLLVSIYWTLSLSRAVVRADLPLPTSSPMMTRILGSLSCATTDLTSPLQCQYPQAYESQTFENTYPDSPHRLPLLPHYSA